MVRANHRSIAIATSQDYSIKYGKMVERRTPVSMYTANTCITK